MDHAARMQAFVKRLWELQDATHMTDAQLARRIGIHQAALSRLRNNEGHETVGTKFLIGACSAFPELGFTLLPELQIITTPMQIDTDEEVA